MSEIREPEDGVRADAPRSSAPVVAVILAAGLGVRFDTDNPKQLFKVGGKPIVAWSIEAFEANPGVTDILLVVNDKVRSPIEAIVAENAYPKVRMVITGGAERADSTEAALQTLAEAGIPSDAKVLIHDAVRPFVSQESITGCIEALDGFKAVTVAVPSTDTILYAHDLGDRKVVRDVPDRADMFRAQTPQAFRFDTLRLAYAKAASDPEFHPTDDTRVVVDYLPDVPVAIVAGSETNLKITLASDIPIAEWMARSFQGK
ncbi:MULTISPECIES: IspD/TarI family cytidylyltransferase [Bifidobacterium]|uniref:IspD/TarI family cytidylyltransferase n=1 Tax=Bifidobacterium TaxID=1678 RepID=UPI00068EDFB2|nr:MULTISPECIES: IspD/TarI family cytidylyltransferase [Bifidobacterium]MBH9978312.1 2-C-methyl-D-erythritol 4-phosphate cytidylyltransferase [Bifidobacterium sp. W8108]MBI0173818.1 2-C-methyl-D-erythritol 4-phosphate cytidylyltransferase [Bifidobacterium sp. M0307]MCT6836963.1 2-C-methyl-D-erythritol 4-phosphate cytidylyltransferase [Bifidobacteriales bacterium]MCT6878100.1 2-C-methyl-D-erythritol 4-phosphate cytidylyltransferase [Bifidobacteriales bacterium]